MTRSIAEAAAHYDWKFILLKKNSKAPVALNGHHVYAELDGARRHLVTGGNIGLVGYNLAVLDWDDEAARLKLFDALGPLPLHVRTGKGKWHTYVEADRALPGNIYFEGVIVGQIRRLPTEYVVCPPSIHPDTGERYTVEADLVLAPLPEAWADYLRNAKATYEGAPGEPFEIPTVIHHGARHHVFFRWTRSWKASGFSLDETLEILRLANRPPCPPGADPFGPWGITPDPLDDAELTNFVTRAYNQPDRPNFARRKREAVPFDLVAPSGALRMPR